MLAEYPLLIDGAEELSAKVMDVSSFLASTSIQTRLTQTPGSCAWDTTIPVI